MDFIFFAPFRTNLNINSLKALAYEETALDLLNEVVRCENASIGEKATWRDLPRKRQNGELHYSALSEDSVPKSATPVLELLVSEHYLAAHLAHNLTPEEGWTCTISRCTAHYYDNTVGVLTLEVSFTDVENEAELFQTMDKWSTNLCSSTIELIYTHEEKMRLELSGIKIGKLAYFLSPRDFTVFFDRAKKPFEQGTKYKERMLWATRVFIHTSDQDRHSILESWIHHPLTADGGTKVGNARITTCIGNNVISGVLSENEKEDFKTAFLISTYFYVIYDVLNSNLRTIFLEISGKENVSDSTVSRVNRIRGYIEYIDNEFSDVLMGLQGIRMAIARDLLETWRYSDLVTAVQKKTASVGKVIDYILSEKRSRYGRVIEAILAAIGGVSILEFILNLFTFSANEVIGKDSVHGLVDFVEHIPVDGLLYATIAGLSVVLVLILRKR